MITIKDIKRLIGLDREHEIKDFTKLVNLGVNVGWLKRAAPFVVELTEEGALAAKRVDDRAHVKHLRCACCGSDAPAFLQWHDQDTGYGLCPRCNGKITKKEGAEYVRRTYGQPGVHHSIDITGTPVPGDHSECGPDCCITGDRCDGTHVEPKSRKGHTGGEWEVVFDEDPAGGKRVASIRVKEWKDNDLVGDYRGCIIADLTASHGNRPHAYAEAEANAYLMAAAPGLLGALYVALP